MKRDVIHASVLAPRTRGLLHLLPRQALHTTAINLIGSTVDFGDPLSTRRLWHRWLACSEQRGRDVEPIDLRQRHGELEDILRSLAHRFHLESLTQESTPGRYKCVYVRIS